MASNVGFNSALTSMAAYLGRPTLGGGYSTDSYRGWAPGSTGYSFGPTPDDSLGSLLGPQLPSRNFARLWGPPQFGSPQGYGNLGGVTNNVVTGGVTAYAVAPTFLPQQQANPIQVIGGQMNINVTAGSKANEADGEDTSPIAPEVKAPYEEKLAERGYSSDETEAVLDAAQKASGGDVAKFKRIMSRLPPKKPEGTTGEDGKTAPVTEADKEKFARDYAEWFADRAGEVPAGDRVRFVKDAIEEAGIPAGTVTITSSPDRNLTGGIRRFQITSAGGPDGYARDNYLYRKGGKWYLDKEATNPAQTTSPPPSAGRTTYKVETTDGKTLTLQKKGESGPQHKYSVTNNGGSDISGSIFYDVGRKKWYESDKTEISKLTAPPTTNHIPGAGSATLQIGGGAGSLRESMTEIPALTARLDEHLEEYRATKEAERVEKANTRDKEESDVRSNIRSSDSPDKFDYKKSELKVAEIATHVETQVTVMRGNSPPPLRSVDVTLRVPADAKGDLEKIAKDAVTELKKKADFKDKDIHIKLIKASAVTYPDPEKKNLTALLTKAKDAGVVLTDLPYAGGKTDAAQLVTQWQSGDDTHLGGISYSDAVQYTATAMHATLEKKHSDLLGQAGRIYSDSKTTPEAAEADFRTACEKHNSEVEELAKFDKSAKSLKIDADDAVKGAEDRREEAEETLGDAKKDFTKAKEAFNAALRSAAGDTAKIAKAGQGWDQAVQAYQTAIEQNRGYVAYKLRQEHLNFLSTTTNQAGIALAQARKNPH